MLENIFYVNYTYHDTPLILYRERLGLFPLEETDGLTSVLLEDFISTIRSEREILKSVGILPSEFGTTSGTNLTGIPGMNFFSFLRSGWKKFLNIWSLVINVIVSLYVILKLIQFACTRKVISYNTARDSNDSVYELGSYISSY
jgi:hypothetical protein